MTAPDPQRDVDAECQRELLARAERAEAELTQVTLDLGRAEMEARKVPDLIATIERAEAEVSRLQQWKDEAAPVMIGLQDLGKALGIPLGTRITGEVAAEKARALADEVAELRADLELDRASDERRWSADDDEDDCDLPWRFVRDIRAALDGAGESE